MTLTPSIQYFHDPVNGACNQLLAIRTDINQIIGFSDFDSTYSRFYFPDGTFLNRASETDTGLTYFPDSGSCIYSTPYGSQVWSAKDGAANNVGIAWLDPYTTPWTVIGTWGFSSGFEKLPDNVPAWFSIASVTTGRYNWLVGGTDPGGDTYLMAANPELAGGGTDGTQVGYWGNIFSEDQGICHVTAGPQEDNTATVFWRLRPHSVAVGNTYAIGKLVITDAEKARNNWNSNTFPTVNPYVTNETIRTYSPSDFQNTATDFYQFSSLAYDQTDGNVIAYVSVKDGSSNYYNYFVKFSSEDGSIIWQLPIFLGGSPGPGFSDDSVFTRSVISEGKLYFFEYYIRNDPPPVHTINTITGTDSIQSWLRSGASLSLENQISNDRIGGIICSATWNKGSGNLITLNSTPSSGTNELAVVYIDNIKHDHVEFCSEAVSSGAV